MRYGHDGTKGLIARHKKSRGVQSRQCNIRRLSSFDDNMPTDGAQLPPFHAPECARAAELHTPLRASI
jgi:hypothetical protein